MRRLLASMIGCAVGALATAAVAQDYAWKPDRPVNIIVPWAAGGSTDQMARIVATELEAELKQKFIVVNQPGASGSVGTKNVVEAPKDGYTWAAGAATDIGTYRVLGLLDSGIKDWHLFFAVANLTAISANPNAPFKDFGQLLEALKKDPTIPIATAGLSSAGHNFMESVKAAAKIDYKHVTYDGGNPAVLATVSGETQAVAQLLVEMSEFIKGKRLVPACRVVRQADHARRLRRDPADHEVAAQHAGTDELLRHLVRQGNARQRRQDHGRSVGEEDQELRGAQEVCGGPQRPFRAALRRRGRAGVLQDGALLGLALFRRRKGQGIARHAGHPAPLVHGPVGTYPPTQTSPPFAEERHPPAVSGKPA